MKLRNHSMLIAALLVSSSGWVAAATSAAVFKSPSCGCCEGWIKHMKANGFDIATHNVGDVSVERKKMSMPARLASCHIARVGPYVIEGHVPASDIQRLLREKPKALGLAVPGMVAGSPGMESAGNSNHYDTLLVNADGATSVFSRH